MKLAVGFFDGVHLGHRRILAGADAALTFTNHPLTVLSPAHAPSLIMSLSERISAISSALSSPTEGPGPTQLSNFQTFKLSNLPIQGSGPNSQFPRVHAIPFTSQIRDLAPKAFIGELKRHYPELELIRCGPNWRFGAGGEGDADYARGMGVSVEEVPFVLYKGEAVSSTRIRRALAEGNVAEAAGMLGRGWSMSGEVFAGKGEGRKLGFPTLNVRPAEPSLPLRKGVYAVETEWGRAVANWGTAPTMGATAWSENVLEVHLLHAPESFSPPCRMTAVFLRFIRPECKFANEADLASQIAKDCLEVEALS